MLALLDVPPCLCGQLVLSGREVRILQHEPLWPAIPEIDLHARVRAPAFRVDDHPGAELGVDHALTDPPRRGGRDVQGPRFNVPSTRFDIPGSRFKVAGTRFITVLVEP